MCLLLKTWRQVRQISCKFRITNKAKRWAPRRKELNEKRQTPLKLPKKRKLPRKRWPRKQLRLREMDLKQKRQQTKRKKWKEARRRLAIAVALSRKRRWAGESFRCTIAAVEEEKGRPANTTKVAILVATLTEFQYGSSSKEIKLLEIWSWGGLVSSSLSRHYLIYWNSYASENSRACSEALDKCPWDLKSDLYSDSVRSQRLPQWLSGERISSWRSFNIEIGSFKPVITIHDSTKSTAAPASLGLCDLIHTRIQTFARGRTQRFRRSWSFDLGDVWGLNTPPDSKRDVQLDW